MFCLQQLASIGLEDQAQLTIWDWKKGKVIASTRGHNDRVCDLVIVVGFISCSSNLCLIESVRSVVPV